MPEPKEIFFISPCIQEIIANMIVEGYLDNVLGKDIRQFSNLIGRIMDKHIRIYQKELDKDKQPG